MHSCPSSKHHQILKERGEALKNMVDTSDNHHPSTVYRCFGLPWCCSCCCCCCANRAFQNRLKKNEKQSVVARCAPRCIADREAAAAVQEQHSRSSTAAAAAAAATAAAAAGARQERRPAPLRSLRLAVVSCLRCQACALCVCTLVVPRCPGCVVSASG